MDNVGRRFGDLKLGILLLENEALTLMLEGISCPSSFLNLLTRKSNRLLMWFSFDVAGYNPVRIMSQQALHQLDRNQMFLVRVVLRHFEPCQWMPFWRNFGKIILMNLFEQRKQSHLLFHAPLCHRSIDSSMASCLDMFLNFLCLYVSCILLLSSATYTCRKWS